jgi:hypothetical protein
MFFNTLIPLIISFSFFLTNVISPQIGFILTFMSPIFLVHYLNNRDRIKNTDLISIVAIIASAAYSPLLPVYYLLLVFIPTVLIHLYYQNKIKINPLIFAPLPLFLFSTFVLIFFNDYKQELINMIIKNIKIVTDSISPDLLLTEQGSKLVYLKNNSKQIATTIVHLLPATSFAYVALIAFSTNRFYYNKYKLKPLVYKVPDILFIPLVIGGFMILIKTNTTQWIAYNTLIIYVAMFFMQGLEVINVLFIRYKIAIFLRMIIYIVLFSEPTVMLILSAVGLSDNWLNFTKKLQAKIDEKNE